MRTLASATVLLSTLAAGCTGLIGDGGPEPGAPAEEECVGCTESGIKVADSSRFPRLSHAQWENTVQDLFFLDAPTGLSSAFAPDPLGGKSFDTNQSALAVTPTLWADYQNAAESIATMVTSDPALLAKIVPADLPEDPAARKAAWIASFGKRAFRRPLTESEIAEVTVAFDGGLQHYPELDPFVSGVRLSIELLLQSPHFIYRAELSDKADENRLVLLSGWEIASRLSYAVWNTMPDAELLRAAEAGELDTVDGLDAQAERLVNHARGREMFRRFYDQLLVAKEYESLNKSATMYPDFDPSIGVEMRTELAKFVEHVVVHQGGGVRELMTSRTTFVTPRLAAIYDIDPATLSAPDADGFSQVELDPTKRSGLLTRSGFLAWKGTTTQPDTILRGVFVNLKIICQELPAPPDEASGAELGDQPTNRARVEALTGAGTCGASCHGTFINPMGFALENFGALGEYRADDNGFPIDASSTFPFEEGQKTYANAIELSEILAASPQVHGCFAKSWVEFGLGRDFVVDDQALVDLLSSESQSGASTKDVARTLLASDAIRYRLATTENQ